MPAAICRHSPGVRTRGTGSSAKMPSGLAPKLIRRSRRSRFREAASESRSAATSRSRRSSSKIPSSGSYAGGTATRGYPLTRRRSRGAGAMPRSTDGAPTASRCRTRVAEDHGYAETASGGAGQREEVADRGEEEADAQVHAEEDQDGAGQGGQQGPEGTGQDAIRAQRGGGPPRHPRTLQDGQGPASPRDPARQVAAQSLFAHGAIEGRATPWP